VIRGTAFYNTGMFFGHGAERPEIRRGAALLGRRRAALRMCAFAALGLIVAYSAQADAAETYLSAPASSLPLFSSAILPGQAAGASATVATDQTELSLVSATVATGDASMLRLGLDFTLKPGWKIYWRSPGAAGFPPHLDWTGSDNLKRASVEWPAPERFAVLGLDTFGYHDRVVLPIDLVPARAGAPVALKLKVDYLVCSEICVPQTANLSLDLPAGPATPSRFIQLIDRFENEVPRDGTAAGLSIVSASIDGPAAHPVLEIAAHGREPFRHPDLFVEGPSGLAFAAPRVSLSVDGRDATLRLPISSAGNAWPDWSATPLTFTLVDGARSMETRLAPKAAVPTGEAGELLLMIGLALLGGLILNLMPCVLPVLSLKLLGIVGHRGAARRAIRASFLASAAGVVVSFLALAAAAIGIKLAGGTVGWGIQFQEPIFLTSLALVCSFFAANLWGLFELRLPGFLSDAVEGSIAKRHSGMAGHFLTGVFATLLATPCSAPFLGTALGFALARGPAEIAAIFVALGLGMAAPYLAVAAFPGSVRYLPHGGRWMVAFKIVLGAALAATAAWLVSILVAEIGLEAALAVGATLAGIPLVFLARRHWPDYTRRSSIAALVALVILAFALPSKLSSTAATENPGDLAGWQPFVGAQIPGLVAEGKLVFVDVTADWCLTCKANRTLVLERDPTAELLGAPGIVRMMADWTRPSDEIARYLASFGRYGIPFNAVYGPGAPQGLPLPELLTPDAVRAALREAAEVKHAARD
jgi:suppressor for copper-sensitivity B